MFTPNVGKFYLEKSLVIKLPSLAMLDHLYNQDNADFLIDI